MRDVIDTFELVRHRLTACTTDVRPLSVNSLEKKEEITRCVSMIKTQEDRLKYFGKRYERVRDENLKLKRLMKRFKINLHEKRPKLTITKPKRSEIIQ